MRATIYLLMKGFCNCVFEYSSTGKFKCKAAISVFFTRFLPVARNDYVEL